MSWDKARENQTDLWLVEKVWQDFSSLSLNMRVSITHQNSSELRLYSTFDFVPIFQYIGFPELTFTHSSKVVIKK